MFLLWTLSVVIMAAFTRTAGQSVNQTKGPIMVTQGEPIFLECSYQSTLLVYPFWYIQLPGQGPQNFLKDWSNDVSEEKRRGFSADHNKKQKTFNVRKAISQLSDSADYYCAMSDTVTLARREAEQKHSESKAKSRIIRKLMP